MMRKNGQRSKSSKRKPRNSTSKKQKQQKEHLNNDVAGAVKMEDVKELATESQPRKPKHGTSQPEPSSSSSETLTTPLSLKQLLANLSDTNSDTDSDSEAVAEFRKNNAPDRWVNIARNGLKGETKEDLMKKYTIPESLSMLKAPILNPEIAELLSEEAINFDNQVVERQNQLGVAVAAIMEAMKGILTKKMKRSEILKIVNDAGMLVADTQFTCGDPESDPDSIINMLDNRSNVTDE